MLVKKRIGDYTTAAGLLAITGHKPGKRSSRSIFPGNPFEFSIFDSIFLHESASRGSSLQTEMSSAAPQLLHCLCVGNKLYNILPSSRHRSFENDCSWTSQDHLSPRKKPSFGEWHNGCSSVCLILVLGLGLRCKLRQYKQMHFILVLIHCKL